MPDPLHHPRDLPLHGKTQPLGQTLAHRRRPGRSRTRPQRPTRSPLIGSLSGSARFALPLTDNGERSIFDADQPCRLVFYIGVVYEVPDFKRSWFEFAFVRRGLGPSCLEQPGRSSFGWPVKSGDGLPSVLSAVVITKAEARRSRDGARCRFRTCQKRQIAWEHRF